MCNCFVCGNTITNHPDEIAKWKDPYYGESDLCDECDWEITEILTRVSHCQVPDCTGPIKWTVESLFAYGIGFFCDNHKRYGTGSLRTIQLKNFKIWKNKALEAEQYDHSSYRTE